MNILLHPSKIIMDHLRYPIKFGVIFVIVLVPLLALSLHLISASNDEITFLEKERTGLAYIKSIRQPIEHIQQHRGMVAAYLNGSTEFEGRIKQTAVIVDEKLAELKIVDGELGAQMEIDRTLDDLLQNWENIKSKAINMSTTESISVHSALVADLLALMSQVANSSNITLDPKLDSYYVGDAIVSSLPNMIENMGQARAVASGVAAKSGFDNPKIYVKLAVLSNNIELYFNKASAGLQAAYEENLAFASQLKDSTDTNNQAVRAMQSLINEKLLEPDTITISSQLTFDTATKAISGSYKLYDDLVPKLDRLFKVRIETAQNTLYLIISTVVIILFVVAYLFTGFYYSVIESINLINVAAKQLTSGNLRARISLKAKDEMNQISNSFNEMAENFGRVVNEIFSSSDQVASASEELSAITKQSSQSMDEQQSQTEQVATAMHEMSATVQEVSRNIQGTAEAAFEANSETITGCALIEDAVSGVKKLAEQLVSASEVVSHLEKNSENINAVLEVIKNVADQTNLLALNAAIEAARAGEQGRGFAVVADEVRTLAGRTQQSTEEINQVIKKLQIGSREAVEVMNKSREEVQTVVDQVIKAGASLSIISAKVALINDMSTQIASAAEEQSSTTSEINRNICRISEIAHNTSSGAQQTAMASQDLARLGTELQGLVVQFEV